MKCDLKPWQRSTSFTLTSQRTLFSAQPSPRCGYPNLASRICACNIFRLVSPTVILIPHRTAEKRPKVSFNGLIPQCVKFSRNTGYSITAVGWKKPLNERFCRDIGHSTLETLAGRSAHRTTVFAGRPATPLQKWVEI